MAQHRQAGFTLMELMIALALFSFIGMAAHAMLQSVLRTREVERAHAARLAQVQKALWVMSQDLEQMEAHSLNVPGGGYTASFLRHGLSNPLDLARSDMMQVGLRLEGGTLRRYYWPEHNETAQQAQLLLEGVSDFTLRPVSKRSVEIVVTLQGKDALRRVVEVPDL
ncbi:MAG: type II secretion system protein GspJ [Proteobacteria bacterium]|nr:type II secretion system protein GspJ [Pseudomonadota bacterium]